MFNNPEHLKEIADMCTHLDYEPTTTAEPDTPKKLDEILEEVFVKETNYQPFVLCVCPTWNRFPTYGHLLEEMLNSFLRQTYHRCHLLIINDAGKQKLHIPKPYQNKVTVLNYPDRFVSLGQKYNEGISTWVNMNFEGMNSKFCTLNELFICPFEDDDISLPNRLKLSVQEIMKQKTPEYWKPDNYLYYNKGENTYYKNHKCGVAHNCSIFKYSFYAIKVGGYPEASGNQDMLMDNLMREAMHEPELCQTPIDHHKWFYVYRWGVSPIHLSGNPDTEAYYKQLDNAYVEPGDFEITPRWYFNYTIPQMRPIDMPYKPS